MSNPHSSFIQYLLLHVLYVEEYAVRESVREILVLIKMSLK